MLFTNHPKLFQIPMGHTIHLWENEFETLFPQFEDLIKKAPLDKKHLLYMNHTERDHARRVEIANYFYNKPYCFSRNRSSMPRVSGPDFWKEVAGSKFVLSPLGLEVDCVRTWECFALKSIPIVEHSYLDPLYDGLPILLVHDWNEITESFLEGKYLEFQNKTFSHERGLADYWINLIKEKQENYRNGDRESIRIEATNFSKKELRTFKTILKMNRKLKAPLFYEGCLTNFRPFQLVDSIPTIPILFLGDTWVYFGYKYLREFAFNDQLLKTTKVKMLKTKRRLAEKSRKEPIAYFLDLTHFRHSLVRDIEEFKDFESSLELSIGSILNGLKNGDLFFGNQYDDLYVKEVLLRLENESSISFMNIDDFWYLVK